MSRHRTYRSGFTLIELLAVIVIMAVLLAAAMPAFNSFKQKGIQGPVLQLMSTLRLARQYAITHRQYVYVVFPDNSEIYQPAAEVSKAFRSYAVLAMTNQVSSNFTYVSDWKYLPKGVCFYDPSDAPSEGKSFILCHSATVSRIRFPFPSEQTTNSVKDRIMPAVLFKPNGRAYRYTGSYWVDSAIHTEIIPTDGTILDDISAGTVLSNINLLGSNALSYPIRIFSKTGQIDYKRTK